MVSLDANPIPGPTFHDLCHHGKAVYVFHGSMHCIRCAALDMVPATWETPVSPLLVDHRM